MNIPVRIGKEVAYIRSDSKNYMIGYDRHSVNKRTGETEVRFDPVCFYGNLSALFDSLIRMKVRASTARTLEELKLEIKKAKEDCLGYWDEAAIQPEEAENE
jgi:hypothetical protein